MSHKWAISCYKMRLSFIIIYLAFIVSAKRFSDEFIDESDEHVPFVDSFLDLRGGVRREFALEAAMEDHGRNMICSPLSVLMPLGKLALGAERRAERELLDAIGLTSRKQILTSFAQLITNMEYLPGVNLDVASRIYVNTEKRINRNFMKRTKLIFRSSAQKIRPSNPRKTAETINDWVAEKTRNKIRKLISARDITKDTSLVLVNAIYFAGNWKYRFDSTFTDQFYTPSGSRRIPMMSRQGKYNYWKCDVLNAEIIEIPYEGSQSSMIIVLPFSTSGLPRLLRALKFRPEQLNQALDKMKPADVILSMPKFKIETELDLTNLYKKIGLNNIFDYRHSDLSGIINDESVYVSKAIHKAVIEVNEKGTEAAAATGVQVKYVSLTLNMPIFRANRPFLFYVAFYKEQLFTGVFSGYTRKTCDVHETCQVAGEILPSSPDLLWLYGKCTHTPQVPAIIGLGFAPLPPTQFRFVANHPFYFIISANQDQLFAGIFSG